MAQKQERKEDAHGGIKGKRESEEQLARLELALSELRGLTVGPVQDVRLVEPGWPTWREFVASDMNRLHQAISRSPGGHDAWADRYGLPRWRMRRTGEDQPIRSSPERPKVRVPEHAGSFRRG